MVAAAMVAPAAVFVVLEAAEAAIAVAREYFWQKGLAGKWESGGSEMQRCGGEENFSNARYCSEHHLMMW
jgi:hypothetical protein